MNQILWGHSIVDGHMRDEEMVRTLLGDRWGMLLAGGLDAGIMGFEGCTYVEFAGMEQLLWRCPLTPGTTQGGIGAAHGPREKRYRGVP